MSKGTRPIAKAISHLLIIAEGFLAIGVVGVAQQRAPLNPEFEAYMQSLLSGTLPLRSGVDGHGLGGRPDPFDMSHVTAAQLPASPLGAPLGYDLRGTGRLTAIRDQGDCGSCWAFAAYGALESWLLTAAHGTWDFSENNQKQCHGFDWGPCDGGSRSISTAYLARAGGPVLESADPYVPADTGGCLAGLPVQKHVKDAHWIPDSDHIAPLDNDHVKQAVIAFGAFSTRMLVDPASYNDTNSTYYYDGPDLQDAGHIVCIVGWDDGFDRNLFNPSGAGPSLPPTDGAWIVRNSWGNAFGEGGYFYVSFYDAWFGTYNAVYVNAEDPEPGTLYYQYDPLGQVYGYGWNEAGVVDYAANAFTATLACEIVAVSTYALAVNTAYEFYIKGAIDDPNGVPVAVGTFAYPGYHTVELTTPVPLLAGEDFVVVAALTTPGYGFPLPAEGFYAGYTSAASSNPGESYVSNDGVAGSWYDLDGEGLEMNNCLKAIAVRTAPIGDPDLNGVIDIRDVRLVLQVAMGLIHLTGDAWDACDIDDDGDVDWDDVTILAEFIVGIRTTLP